MAKDSHDEKSLHYTGELNFDEKGCKFEAHNNIRQIKSNNIHAYIYPW